MLNYNYRNKRLSSKTFQKNTASFASYVAGVSAVLFVKDPDLAGHHLVELLFHALR